MQIDRGKENNAQVASNERVFWKKSSRKKTTSTQTKSALQALRKNQSGDSILCAFLLNAINSSWAKQTPKIQINLKEKRVA